MLHALRERELTGRRTFRGRVQVLTTTFGTKCNPIAKVEYLGTLRWVPRGKATGHKKRVHYTCPYTQTQEPLPYPATRKKTYRHLDSMGANAWHTYLKFYADMHAQLTLDEIATMPRPDCLIL